MDRQAFEKFENAVFFKIFKIPSNEQLVQVQNLTKNFFKKKFQQTQSQEPFKILAKMVHFWSKLLILVKKLLEKKSANQQ